MLVVLDTSLLFWYPKIEGIFSLAEFDKISGYKYISLELVNQEFCKNHIYISLIDITNNSNKKVFLTMTGQQIKPS